MVCPCCVYCCIIMFLVSGGSLSPIIITAANCSDLILEVLPFIERAQSSALDRGDVDEYVFAACLRLNKSVTFRRIEPWAISISQVTILDNVILIGNLVAKATAEYTPVFRCLTGAAAACRCRGACAGSIRCQLDHLDLFLCLVGLCRNRPHAHQSAGKGHSNASP